MCTEGQGRTDVKPTNLSTPYESEGIPRHGHRHNATRYRIIHYPLELQKWYRCYYFLSRSITCIGQEPRLSRDPLDHSSHAFVRLLIHSQFSAIFQNHLTICYLITY